MAISTYKTFLMVKEGSAYKKLIDIRSFPDMGGAPEMLETTTLSDYMQTFIAGIQSINALEFEANYEKTDYQALTALEGEQKDYSLWLGGTGKGKTLTPTGSDGKFNFKGELSAYLKGNSTNTPHSIGITIAPSTPIEFDATSTSSL